MVPVGLLSNTSGGAAMAAVFTLAVHRPFRYVAWIGGVDLALVPLLYWLRSYPTCLTPESSRSPSCSTCRSSAGACSSVPNGC
ncbi:hypothetical protein SAVERM_776 [Streptomyces avermitilis MA-4680 = NBRC 14893]|uniref:Uncharacterized protein n=1 Tax=Streptomyces avermitilis (strain ATCC 31267 / DSM 46492 / JCM 5070 / NBRC 14893 / NCIMB 12804 / NRRL 8165 / MA-4680) TaxID=227882 RepID=Q82PU6_STRAW|nr:hypothetical protein SAVERM_776 [Streptomyces avermitilis MA-4680 = NBRC 14893]